MANEIDSRFRILVVDDEPANIRILHNILKDDYAVSGATSGEEALQLAPQVRPDLVLLDMMMPGMDGIQTCQRLKENADTLHVPVIFITSMDDDAKEMEGLETGAVDYIRKPISPAIVKARVKVHLQNSLYVQFLERLLAQRTADLAKTKEEARRLLGR